uniref:DZIP3-like HEPN domain-containing protein n=1 Tax=Magallana gigas TaxID=29159 RepID=A0A8W8MMG5_MAGGI
MCSIPPHKNEWGNDPEPTDRSLSANIERIRIIRNEWYAHAPEFSLTDSDFEQKWKFMSQIVKELEGYFGNATKYQDSLTELKTKHMDPDATQKSLNAMLTVEELQTDVTNLKEDVEEIKKAIKEPSIGLIPSTEGTVI